MPKRATKTITYRVLSWLHVVVTQLHPASRYRWSKRLTKFFFFILALRKTTALKNLRLAFPDRSEQWYKKTIHACYQSYSWNLIHFIGFPESFLDIQIKVTGREALDEALQQGRGAILVTGHFGSWEILGAWLGQNGYPAAPIVQKQRDPGANLFFYERRQSVHLHQIWQKAGSAAMTDAIRQGKILCLLSDQDARKKGLFVSFFNQPSSTPKGTAVFHYRTGAPMILGVCIQQSPFRYEILFKAIRPPAKRNLTGLTQIYTAEMETIIRLYPEQYFWFHRRWKTKP